MSILAECPTCRNKQSNKNRLCKCGENLIKAKRSRRVRYWINYRLPGGKQRREPVGYSIEEAKDADGKRRGQKREGRIFELLPDSKITFNELTEWYLSLEKVKALKSYWLVKLSINKFNTVFGDLIVSSIELADLENYQIRRRRAGKADATIDHEIGKTKTMVFKAFENRMAGADTLRTFKQVKKMLKKGSDVRDRILSLDEYNRIMGHLADHLKPVLATAYYTGMRKNEILTLKWDQVDLKNRMIRLEAADTKDSEARNVPINETLFDILVSLPNRIQNSDSDDHVFQYRGTPITDIRTGLRKACAKAKVVYGRFERGGFVFHDLRHTFNTNMRKAGVTDSVIMEITGHSTREMFDRYNTIDNDDTRRRLTNSMRFCKVLTNR
ncbi:Mobile element protein [Olavius algarvensis associated proteobacterium Delta 3]|nr:Mobile element protein [Olavius algarvensis associated proteobacterium Delta 3]